MASTRRQVRERLGVLFTATGSFNQVNAYAPLDLQGFDKVLNIYNSRSRHRQESANLETNLYTFILDVNVKRTSTENSEDALDDLHEVIRATIRANQGDTTWDFLTIDDASDAYFAEISGIPYRVESHPLTVKVTG